MGNSARASYTYDVAGRLATLRNLRPDDSVLCGFQYLLDATGNRVGVVEAEGDRSTWTYDSTYQLVGERRTGAVSFRITHVYDPAGNRLVHIENGVRTSYTYDAANQLSSSVDAAGVTTYVYDAAGSLALQQAPAGRSTYSWDSENRLKCVQLPGGVVNTMTYNADGLRTVKEDTAGTTKFVWDNQNVLLETDASNTVQAAYTLSPDLYGKLLDQQRSGLWRHYHYDGIDSTSGLSDTNGQLLDNYVYEAYGSLRSSSGSTVNPFRWVGGQGYYFDGDPSQYYIRARHYDSLVARWLSEDPIGYAGGIDLYGYCGNGPLSRTDPQGELPVTLIPSALITAYKYALQKSQKGALDKARDTAIEYQIVLDMASTLKETGEFTTIALRTIAYTYGFDTNGPEDALKKMANNPLSTVTYNPICVVRWHKKKTAGCVDYTVVVKADLTITPKAPPAKPVQETEIWLIRQGSFKLP